MKNQKEKYKVISIFIATVVVGVVLFIIKPYLQSPKNVPDELAGVPLNRLIEGEEAIQNLQHIHSSEIDLRDGAIAIYGSSYITLWIAGAEDDYDASALLNLMVDRIQNNSSSFTFNSELDIEGHRVFHIISHDGQTHFTWQSERLVIWLSAEYQVADQALEEAISFFTE